MKRGRRFLEEATERGLAKKLFNGTWDLLGKKRRSRDEADEMLHMAHASRYHWGVVGRPLNRSIAEWQLSRVYSELGRSEPATFHGRRALEIAARSRLAPFYVAYGHEALARAAAIRGDRTGRDSEIRRARRILPRIRGRDDRRMLEEDLDTIP